MKHPAALVNYKMYKELERMAVSWSNRTWSATNSTGIGDPIHLQMIQESVNNSKDRYQTILDNLCSAEFSNGGFGPIYHWCIAHKGLGISLTTKLLCEIDDIQKFDTVAKLWSFAGYGLHKFYQNKGGKIVAPVQGHKWIEKDGERQMIFEVVVPESDWTLTDFAKDIPIVGWNRSYNTKLKSVVYLISKQFIMNKNDEYYKMYKEEKDRQMFNTKSFGHADMRARRFISKFFLKQLWIEWKKFDDVSIAEYEKELTSQVL